MIAQPDAASFRDPSGFVFRRDGVLYRQVDESYREHYDALIQSGLYDHLVDAGLLVPHDEVSPGTVGVPGAYRVLRPRPVPFVSYPYEWCFGELRDAALTTLDVQKRALEHGLTLKDSSAFNIQFADGRTVLIDTLSFERYRDGVPWIAYRQFCQHFLAPLVLMRSKDVRLGGLLRQHLDGIPLDLTSRLLPRGSWLRFGTLLHIHLHARSQRRFAHTPLRGSALNRPVGKTALRGLIDSLDASVRRLAWRPAGTEWAEYTREHTYPEAAFRDKERLVREFVMRVAPGVVWDLGANTGMFSRIAAERGARVVALDKDPAAVERLYQAIRARGEARVLPLLVDLSNPSPALGWAHRERMALLERGPADLVLALALVHHLAISNNVPLPRLARFFAAVGRHLIIEFVPKADGQVQRLLGSREDIFPDYTQDGFEARFAEAYEILDSAPLADSLRRLYLMRKR